MFDAAETLLITDVVLVETVWTLAGRKYRLAKAELVAVLERLFSEPNIRFEDDSGRVARFAGVPKRRASGRGAPDRRRVPVSPMR